MIMLEVIFLDHLPKKDNTDKTKETEVQKEISKNPLAGGLFDDNVSSDLFGSSSKKDDTEKMKETEVKKGGLFDDNVGGNLFGSSSKKDGTDKTKEPKKEPKKEVNKVDDKAEAKEKNSVNTPAGGLFDDVGGDLFGSSSPTLGDINNKPEERYAKKKDNTKETQDEGKSINDGTEEIKKGGLFDDSGDGNLFAPSPKKGNTDKTKDAGGGGGLFADDGGGGGLFGDPITDDLFGSSSKKDDTNKAKEPKEEPDKETTAKKKSKVSPTMKDRQNMLAFNPASLSPGMTYMQKKKKR